MFRRREGVFEIKHGPSGELLPAAAQVEEQREDEERKEEQADDDTIYHRTPTLGRGLLGPPAQMDSDDGQLRLLR